MWMLSDSSEIKVSSFHPVLHWRQGVQCRRSLSDRSDHSTTPSAPQTGPERSQTLLWSTASSGWSQLAEPKGHGEPPSQLPDRWGGQKMVGCVCNSLLNYRDGGVSVCECVRQCCVQPAGSVMMALGSSVWSCWCTCWPSCCCLLNWASP